MDSSSENLTAQESLAIITSMIREAQTHLKRNGFYFLFWGWVVAIANLSMFILTKVGYPHPYLAWLITVPAWVVTIIRMWRTSKSSEVKTHLDSISTWTWISFGVVTATLVFFGATINYQLNPVILLITAIPTAVSGVVIRFKPLVYGAVFFWGCSIVSFLVPMEIQSLVGALAIGGGYLLPAHLLKSDKA